MLTYSEMVHGSVRDILNVVFRHLRKILATFIVLSVLVIGFTFAAPEIYRSEAEILIRSGRENLSVELSQDERNTTMVHDRQSQESFVNTEVAILRSRHLASRVVEEVGVEALLTQQYPENRDEATSKHALAPVRSVVRGVRSGLSKALIAMDLATETSDTEAAILKLANGLTVEPLEQSNIIQASVEFSNRRLAKDVLDLLIEYYLERHIEVNASDVSPAFFEEQANERRRELEAVEEELEAFRKEHGIAALNLQQETILLQIKDMEQQRDSSLGAVRASKARVEELEKALAGRPSTIEISRTTGRHNYALDALKDHLLELQIEEIDLEARYKDTYPPLMESREKVQAAEEMLDKEVDTHTEVTTGLDLNQQKLMLDLETERTVYEANKAEYEVMAAEVERLHEQLQSLAAQYVKLGSLERRQEMAAVEYSQYRDNLHRARISDALDKIKASNASVVQDATLPIEPVRPKKLLVIAVGLVFSLFAGLGVAYLSEYFDDTFRTDSDVEKWLDLPVLASVSEEDFKECT